MFLVATVSELVLAQADSAPAQTGGLQGMVTTLGFPLLMFAVIYFLLIRPAGKQRREHASMLNALKRDDEVVTTGGIVGKIATLDDRIITLEVADKVKIRVLRDRVAGRFNPPAASPQQKK